MAGDDPPADAATGARARARARSSTSPATRAGAGSRRPTARTRTSRPSLGCAYVRGAPGRRPRATASLATAKHMVGHGLAEGGLNQAPAHLGPRELRDEQLLPFEAAVRDAGHRDRHAGLLRRRRRPVPRLARAARRRSCATSGASTGSSPPTTWASRCSSTAAPADRRPRPRRRDWRSRRASTASCRDRRPSARRCATALADGRRRRGAASTRPSSAMLRHEVPARAVRAAVRRAADAGELAALAAEEARAGPRRSPRARWCSSRTTGSCRCARTPARIAVIGPDRRQRPRPPRRLQPPGPHRDARARSATGRDAFGVVGDGDVIEPGRRAGRPPTILDALRDALAAPSVVHARGHRHLATGPTRSSPRPSRSPRGADVAIVVVGERSGLTDDSTTGEFRDRRDLGLLGRQQELLEAVVATGTPVVLVVVSGRPLALEWAAEHCAAILLAWVPGDAGPDAIADVLAGRRRTRAAGCRSRCPRYVGPGPADVPPPPDGRPLATGRATTSTARSTPLWPFGLRALVHDVHGRRRSRLDRDAARDDGRRGHGPGRRHEHRDAGRRRGRPALRPRRGGDRSPARSSSCAGSGGCTSSPASAGPSPSTSPPSSSRTSAPTYRRVVEPGASAMQVGTSSVDLPLAAELAARRPRLRARRAQPLPDDVDDRVMALSGRGGSSPGRR